MCSSSAHPRRALRGISIGTNLQSSTPHKAGNVVPEVRGLDVVVSAQYASESAPSWLSLLPHYTLYAMLSAVDFF